MSDYYYQLSLLKAAQILSPQRITKDCHQPIILTCSDDRQLLINSQVTDTPTTIEVEQLNVGNVRIIGFGDHLDGEKVTSVLLRLIEQFPEPLSLHSYQPLPEMRPSVVICGVVDDGSLKELLAQLAQSLQVELVALTHMPTLAKPGVLLMDMDSTAIQIECIDEIAVLAGVGEQVAAVTKQAMQGELDFSQSLIQRVCALANADEAILSSVADTMPLMPGLVLLVDHLKARGWVVAIASGGFTYFTERLKQRLGLTATYANQLEIIDGKLTGKVVGEIVDAQVKSTVITQLAQTYHIDVAQTVAIGDGANDLLMLNKAALGVAFHAKPIVREQAQVAVNHGGLEQLLYLLQPTKSADE